MADREPGRRGLRWSLAILAIALVWLLASVTPAPFAIERPGPVVDALGEVDPAGGAEGGEADDGGTAVLVIDGAETFETSGELNVLSVSIVGSPESPISWVQLLGALLDPTRTIVPIGQLYPEGVTTDDRVAAGAAMMQSSQHRAVAAALRELGEPVDTRLRIVSVVPDGPSDGALREGDVLLAVDGEPIATMEQLRGILAADPGAPLALLVSRDGTQLEVGVEPVAPDPGAAPLLGVTIATEYDFPFEVEVNLGDIGGPSAGAMLALAVYDRLTPGGMTGGLRISGTGTIDDEGRIGPVGGLQQKLWGASRAGTDLFLVPIGNCAELPERIPDGMAVAPVATLREAIDAVEAAAVGRTPPGPERCSGGEFVRSSD